MGIELLAKLQPFAIALALGLLIGVERERSHPPGYQPLGLRTFVLLSLLGALAAEIQNPWIAVSITLFVGAAVIAGYLLSSKRTRKEPDIGITTEIAAVVTYILGYLAHADPLITLIIGVLVLVVLLARTRLHQFSRSQLRPEELSATTILLVLALGILPLLPDRAIDPWHLFNPLRFGSLVLIIAVLQFCGYAGIRIFGPTQGILLSGFLAGLVSSTAATATLANQAKRHTAPPLTLMSAVILATIAMFIKLLAIIFIASPGLFYLASLPSVITSVALGLVILTLGRYIKTTDHYPPPENPLALWSALRLAFLLGIMLVLVMLTQRLVGHYGTQAVAFLGGLVEIHGIVLAIATLYQSGQLTLMQAINNIGLAVLASFLSKLIITWSITRSNYALIASLMFILMALIYVGIWLAVVLTVPS